MSSRRKDEEALKRRRYIRMRFRGLIRAVIMNKSWLQDTGEQKISSNVKKNIAMIIRRQRKIGILTLNEKAIIRNPSWARSIDDRKHLVKLMCSLLCFSRFPPKIRARLAPVVKFMFVNAGRLVMREGYPPMAIYFILTGEVVLSQKLEVPKKDGTTEQVKFILGPGDSVGEIDLIEQRDRLYTCKVTSDAELLAIFEDDFNRILRPFMSEQWEQKKLVLKSFDYFKNWSSDQITFVCKIGILKQYEPLETIYFEDKGDLNPVYFIISGQCMILQCLKIRTRKNAKNQKSYELCEATSANNGLLFSNLSNTELLKKLNEEDKCGSRRGTVMLDISMSSIEEQQPDDEMAGIMSKIQKGDASKYISPCGVQIGPQKPTTEGGKSENDKKATISDRSSEKGWSEMEELEEQTEEVTGVETDDRSDASSQKGSEKKEGVIENHFVDAGSFTYGAIFGLGEKMENRAIMARTTVQCLMIPRFWLFEKKQNPGNMWQRMRFHLNATIPSRENLFKDFVATQKWHKYKKDLIEGYLSDAHTNNPTKREDIPIICRIVEAHEE